MGKKTKFSNKTILDLYYNPTKIQNELRELNQDSKVKAEEFVKHSEAFLAKLPEELKEEYMEIVDERMAHDQDEFNDLFVHAFHLGLRLAAESFLEEEE